ncbi:MAG TPA: transcriptional regulator NrdR [Halanaerobiales bacterium]|nr:transcriptional regulator NrdR [Halanaerobiales bacterium]
MKCPYCEHLESKVIDSRYTGGHTCIRRRRECLDCGERFTTYERLEDIPLMVVKRNGQREMFDRNKLVTGLLKACEKRTISKEKIDNLVDNIERELQNDMKTEVKSTEIGELVMKDLKEMDEVAYVRFASVYRQFKDVNKFKQELESLLGED